MLTFVLLKKQDGQMKIICVGMNYATHNKEMHNALIIKEPTIFMKPDVSLLKDGKPFFIPDFSSDMQYETEIVVKISKLGKSIARRFAHRYFEEVTVGIDMTARDLQKNFRDKGLPWELSKSFDGSAVVGRFVRIDELTGDINHLPFHLDINGTTVQEGNTSAMLFKIDEIIEYVSQFVTLKIGDLIYTGTPAGVGNIHINDHLQGYIGDTKLLEFDIK
jgi:2-keto-4-pentenoate hydratase/2-oxohepta-3-ene-1,7-dioic acid hydratase in catechol pathway